MNLTTDRETGDVDAILSRYFKQELPHPWPSCEALDRPTAVQPQRQRWLNSSHLALAASVALLVLGYLLLAGAFPQPANRPLGVNQHHNLGADVNPGQQLRSISTSQPRFPPSDSIWRDECAVIPGLADECHQARLGPEKSPCGDQLR